MKLTGLMRMIVATIVIFSTTIISLQAQTTASYSVVQNTGLPDLGGSGSADWGDYNNDGYPDVVMFGFVEGSATAGGGVYKNRGFGNEGKFESLNETSFTPALPRVKYGSVAWVDYDNDGWLDLFVSGYQNTNTAISVLYHNNGEALSSNNYSCSFTRTITFAGIVSGSAKWVDLNNDGLLDLYEAGLPYTSKGPAYGTYGYDNNRVQVVYIYQNNGNGTFTNVATSTGDLNSGWYESDIVFLDFNNDGLVDAYTEGNTNSAAAAYYGTSTLKWKAIDDSYVRPSTNTGWFIHILDNNNSGAFCFKAYDFDGDGYEDILHVGGGRSRYTTIAWNKNAKGQSMAIDSSFKVNSITYLDAIPAQVVHPYSAAIGDYNNDGLMDVLIAVPYVDSKTIAAPSDLVLRLYENLGNRQFQNVSLPDALVPRVHGSVNFVDFDSDGKLDIFYFGSGSRSYLYNDVKTVLARNTAAKDNNLPNDSDNPSSVDSSMMWSKVEGANVTFYWRRSSDPETPSKFLRYNIRIKKSGAEDYYISGKQGASSLGVVRNSLSDTVSLTIQNIPKGSYGWSVQAVDGMAFCGSWSVADSFKVLATQASDIEAFDITETSMKLRWTKGSQKGVAVFMYPVSYPSYPPIASAPDVVDKKYYPFDNRFASAKTITLSSNWRCVFHSNASSDEQVVIVDSLNNLGYLKVTGLSPGTQYIVSVIGFDGAIEKELYFRQAASSGNPKAISTPPFVTTSTLITGLPLLKGAISAWGDYNNDGNLDVVYSGVTATNDTVTVLYKHNDDGTFTAQSEMNFPALQRGSLEWGDYNNDGFLDLLITGNTTQKSGDGRKGLTAIYKNNNGVSFSLVENHGLPNVGYSAYGSVARWADFNNDGILDVVIAGCSELSFGVKKSIAKVYKGVKGSNFLYELAGTLIPTGVDSASVVVGDVNNDGFQDIVLSGTGTLGYNSFVSTMIFTNKKNCSFETVTSSAISGCTVGGSMQLGDINKDGWLDLLMCGGGESDGDNATFGVYLNSGTGFILPSAKENISEMNTDAYRTVTEGAAALVDYDNDSYFDIVFSGKTKLNTPISWVIKNNFGAGSGSHLIVQSSLELEAMQYSNLACSDFNNDGITDILLTGLNSSNVLVSKVYYVETAKLPVSAAPSPKGLTYQIRNDSCVLSWDMGSLGTSYNIRVFNSSEVIPLVSDASSGKSKFLAIRGALQTNNYVLSLPMGNYEWKVQADSCGVLSSWSDGPSIDNTLKVKVQATNLTFSDHQTQALGTNKKNCVSVSWVKQDIDSCIVFAYESDLANLILPAKLAQPTNGTSYYAPQGDSCSFKQGSVVSDNWYCIYKGLKNSIVVNNLDSRKVYSFVVYTLDSSSPNTYYLTDAKLSYTYMRPYSAVTAVTKERDNLSYRKIATLKFTPAAISLGGGLSRVIFMKASSDLVTDVIPVDGVSYTPAIIYNPDGSKIVNYAAGDEVGEGWKCVFNGTAEKVSIQLKDFVSTTSYPDFAGYSFVVYDYNGISGKEIYSAPNAFSSSASKDTFMIRMPFVPTLDSYIYRDGIGGIGDYYDAVHTDRDISVHDSVLSNAMILGCQKGNGWKRAIFMIEGTTDDRSTAFSYDMKKGSPSASDFPVLEDGVHYKASNVFGTDSTRVGTSNWYCVYNGVASGSSVVRVNNLKSGTFYRSVVAEYNADFDSGNEKYMSFVTNFKYKLNLTNHDTLRSFYDTISDYTVPTKQVTNLTLERVGSTDALVKWTNGNGSNRLVLLSKGDEGDINLENEVLYSPKNGDYSGVSIKSTGWYCVYSTYSRVKDATLGKMVGKSSSDTSFTITGLIGDNTKYRVKVVEYNGDLRYADKDDSGTPYCWNKYNNSSEYGANIVNFSTVLFNVPTNQVTNLKVESADINRSDIAKISWTRGEVSTATAIFVSEGDITDTSLFFKPTNNNAYDTSYVYGQVKPVSSKWQCVYKGSNSSVILSGLSRNKSYTAVAYDYNGDLNYEKFNTDNAAVAHFISTDHVAPTSQVMLDNASPIIARKRGAEFRFVKSDGYGIVVFVKSGSLRIDTLPEPLEYKEYVANQEFGKGDVIYDAKGEAWYCIYNGTNTTNIYVTQLDPSKTYVVRALSYNSNYGGTEPVYNREKSYTGDYLNPKAFTTLSQTTEYPAVQTSKLEASNIKNDRITLKWNKGDGDGRIIMIKEKTLTADINQNTIIRYAYFSPQNFVSFTANSEYGKGLAYNVDGVTSNVQLGWYCAYNGNGTDSVVVTGLNSNSLYVIEALEYYIDSEGGANSIYNTSYSPYISSTKPYVNIIYAFTPPTTNSTITGLNQSTTSFNSITWTVGNGNGRAVFMREGTSTNVALPIENNVRYTPYSDFSSSKKEDISYSGWYCVYNDTANLMKSSYAPNTSFTVTGLTPNTKYSLRIVEYNTDRLNKITYVPESYINSVDTTTAPLQPDASLGVYARVTASIKLDQEFAYPNSVDLTWPKLDVQNYLVAVGTDKTTVKQGAAYSANTAYGTDSNAKLSGDWYVVYNGSGTSCSVTNLSSDFTYNAFVFPYNGNTGTGNERYLKTNVEATQFHTDFAVPNYQASFIRFLNVQPTQFRVTYKRGDGVKVAVFVSESSNSKVTPHPLHNLTYVAKDSMGAAKASKVDGWQCVYIGTEDTILVKGVKRDTEYKVMVVEYNGTVGYEKYNRGVEIDNPAVIVPTLTSTESLANQVGVSVYPNPVIDLLTVKAEGLVANEIRLYNMDGTLIFTQKLTSQPSIINVKGLVSGLYVVKVETNKGVYIKQIVKH